MLYGYLHERFLEAKTMKSFFFCLLFILLSVSVLQVKAQDSDVICTLGRTDLEETSANPTPGLFIDLDNPATCSGQVLQWRLCYYNPSNFHPNRVLQIGLQVWRFDQPQRRGSLVGQNILVVTIPIPEELENFQCITLDPSEDEPLNVTEGDLLGVTLRQDLVLPVIANGPNQNPAPRMLFMQPSVFTVTEVDRDSVEASAVQVSNVLHLTAEIGVAVQRGTPATSTAGPAGTPQPSGPVTVSTQTTDGIQDEDGAGGLAPGVTAAIVVVILVVLVLLVVGILVGVLMCCMKMRGKEDEVKITHDSFTIDNAVYDQPDIQQGAHLDASTYEIPINTVLRTGQPKQPQMGGGEDPALYSTVAGSDAEFLDSFESEYNVTSHNVATTRQEHPQAEDSGATGGFNPYATLNATGTLQYYNTFFQKATSAIYYSTPEAGNKEPPYQEPPNNEEDIYKELSNKTWTIRRKEIVMREKIGEGAFSSVSKGSWTRMGRSYDVAVKSLLKNSTEIDKIKLLQEAAIMGQFQHPNIVKLFGVIKLGNSPMLVTEFLHKGDLLDTLQSMQPDPGQMVEAKTPQLLLNFSQQVGLGMHYLSSKGFVHRDLAARNIFVTKDNICKVGDFGMSRELADTDYYVSRGGVVPVRWTAPEAIFYRKYSTASDVWSYGCLLYEIWTLGMRPYEGIETSKYLETLQVGYRLPPPPGCPRAIYEIMMKCWHPTASDRPNFSEILSSTIKDKQEAVLSIPAKDGSTHEQASLLGASLEAGLDMYKDLQNIYLKPKEKTASSIKEKQKKTSSLDKGYTNVEDKKGSLGAAKQEWAHDQVGLYEMEEPEDSENYYEHS